MDQHDKLYQELTTNGEEEWKKYMSTQHTLDALRHLNMLEPIKEFINKGDTWLTIGDGRYGSEAQYLQLQGLEVVASDMNIELLDRAYENQAIKKYIKADAEALDLPDNHVDFILIKETLHHCRRPWLAIYEALRVAKKGVIIIEPNDRYNWARKIEDWIRRTIGKSKKEDFWWEVVGNFGYSFSVRELKKLALGYSKVDLYIKEQNDVYMKGLEKVKANKGIRLISQVEIRYRIKKIAIETLIKLRVMRNNLILAAILHEETIVSQGRKIKGWNKMELPANPYLNGQFDALP